MKKSTHTEANSYKPSEKKITEHVYSISKSQRNLRNEHKSFLILFTGLSGSGKSTIANQLEIELYNLKTNTYLLDGDNLRLGLNKDLGFSLEDRTENLRRVAEVSKLMIDAGLITIAAFVSPMQKDREMIKEIVGDENYVEIFVNTPLEICEQRDVKGLYAKARRGEILDFTGISSPYQAPLNASIEINTEDSSVDHSVQKIVKYLRDNLFL